MKIGRSLRYVSHTSPYTIFDIILDFYECKIYSEQFIQILQIPICLVYVVNNAVVV